MFAELWVALQNIGCAFKVVSPFAKCSCCCFARKVVDFIFGVSILKIQTQIRAGCPAGGGLSLVQRSKHIPNTIQEREVTREQVIETTQHHQAAHRSIHCYPDTINTH